jgi:prephenate dehydrogenase
LDELTLPDPLDFLHADFRKVAILGVGLIGGSVGLRMKKMEYPATIVGYDRQDVLDEAIMRGAIDHGVGDISEAVVGADLIVLAMSVEEVERVLPTVLRTAKPGAVVTDTAGAKKALCALAQSLDNPSATYVGGHPLAGSRTQGIVNAHSDLFANAYWLLTPCRNVKEETVASLKWWIRMLGAHPIVLDAALHDRIAASTTHMPLVLALALSDWLSKESLDTPLLSKLATGHFQSMTAMAALPLSAWESVLTANKEDTERALDDFLRHFGEAIKKFRDGGFEEIWQGAHALQRKLAREKPGDWDSQSELSVTVSDRPGSLARVAGLLADHGINIRDIGMIHSRERMGGMLRVTLESHGDARNAIQILTQHGFPAMRRD